MEHESDVKKILDKTDDGLKVFVHYLGKNCQNKTFRNPYRDDDRPSCRLYYHLGRGGGGKWYFHDYGNSDWHGDCFWFVSKICDINLDTRFRDVLHVIDKELNIFVLDDTSLSNHAYTPMAKRETDGLSRPVSKIVGFVPEFRPFTRHELSYWGQYGITEDWLDRMDVRSVRHCAFTRADGTTFEEEGTYDAPVFAYTFPVGHNRQDAEVRGMKLYRPNSCHKSRFMYVGQLPRPYIFGSRDFLTGQDVPPKDTVYITGGEKDVLSLLSHGFDAVCFNSETANIPDFIIQRLTHSYRHVVFLYDCDETGLKESKAREEQFQSRHPNVSRVVLPLKGTKQEKDISDFFKCGHSPDELVKLTHEAQSSASNQPEQDNYEEINDEHSHTPEQARKCFRL